MKIKIIIILLFISTQVFGQIATVPYKKLISEAKKTVLPIYCIKITAKDTVIIQGTSVIVSQGNELLILTCEHNLVFNDTTDLTQRYFDNIFVNANKKDGTASPIKLKIEYTNNALDFALLSIIDDTLNLFQILINKYNFTAIQKSLWMNTVSLKEGDQVLYIGYPMLKSINYQNYPISRTGMIAQKIEGQHFFLIDGFVQHGHSGSPVFLIREEGKNMPPKWEFKLIGISIAYPNEFSNVLEEVKLKETGKKVILNPGFTVVTTMDSIIPEINKLLK